MKSEAKKRSDNKYDLAHYQVLGCKVKKEYAEEFKAKCKDYGTSPNEIFKKAIQSFIEYPEDWTDNTADPEDQEPKK